MKDSAIQAVAATGTVAITIALGIGIVLLKDCKKDCEWPEQCPDDHKPILKDMIEIEASLAYQSPKAPVQPQKKTQEKEPEVKPEGVSHDPDKKPDVKPKPADEKKPKPDDTDPLKKYHRQDDDTPTSDKPTEPLPAFNGSKFGTDTVTTGHPFWQQMKVDLAWEYPTILDAAAPSIGCIHLEADGKIPEITIHSKSGDDSLDDAAERSLKRLQKKRNDNPIPVPTELLKPAVLSQFVCFKFDAKKS